MNTINTGLMNILDTTAFAVDGTQSYETAFPGAATCMLEFYEKLMLNLARQIHSQSGYTERRIGWINTSVTT
jgi:hypothetical protein